MRSSASGRRRRSSKSSRLSCELGSRRRFCYSDAMTIALIAIGAFAATFLGGLAALRFKDKLHLILGFSAGAVVAVAL